MDAATQDERVSRGRAFFDATVPYASGGTYVNFMTEDRSGRTTAAYGANRGWRTSKRYDPENMFHLNQNVNRQDLASQEEVADGGHGRDLAGPELVL
jgi:hypothetical protein